MCRSSVPSVYSTTNAKSNKFSHFRHVLGFVSLINSLTSGTKNQKKPVWQHLQRRLLRKPIFREHCPSPVILNGPRLPSPPLRFCHVSTNESLVSTISLLFFTPLVKYLAHTAHTRTGPRHIRGCGTTAKWARRLLAPLGQASEEPPLDATIVKRVTAKRKDAELVTAGSPLVSSTGGAQVV